MAIEVFNRHEIKYRVSDVFFKELVSRLDKYMEIDKHCRDGKLYSICNIYYDTEDHAIIRKSIEKPKYKEKLRLRSYNVPGHEDKVFLEIKKKYNGFVNKRRTILRLNEAYSYIRTGVKPDIKPYMNQQVLREIDYMVQGYHKLVPMLYLSYDRYALFGKEDKSFRVTFDTNIRVRRYDVGLEKGNFGEALIEPGIWIMEVKVEDTVPLWFTKLLSEYKLYPITFSKYGTEYIQNILHNNHERPTEDKVG